jgi:hypothetical protein
LISLLLGEALAGGFDLGVFRDRVSVTFHRPLIDPLWRDPNVVFPNIEYSLPVVVAVPVSFERLVEVIESFTFVAASSLDHGFLLATGAKTIPNAFRHPAKLISISAHDTVCTVTKLVRVRGGWWGTRENTVHLAPDDVVGVRDAVEELLPWFEWKPFVEGDPNDGPILFDPTKYQPKIRRPATVPSFNSKSAWLAIKTTDRYVAADRLFGGNHIERAIGKYFSTLTGNDACLVGPFGYWMIAKFGPSALGRSGADLLARLSVEFGESQVFLSERNTPRFGWQRWSDGELVRSWATDATFPRQGEITAIETELAGQFDEAAVIAIAANWSVDPSTLSTQKALNPKGIFGQLF